MDGITTENMDGITIGSLTEDGSGSVHELNTDYYTSSMFDLTSTVSLDSTIDKE